MSSHHNPRKKRKYKKWKEPKKERPKFWKSEYVVGSKEWINQVYQLKPKNKVSKETRQRRDERIFKKFITRRI